MQRTRRLLLLGIAVPILYFGTLFVAASTWPGYSHQTRYASELGGPEAPKPWVFNSGSVFMGSVCIGSAFGFGRAVVEITGRRVPSVLAGFCIGLFGVSMLMGGLFPMPNPLHGGLGLVFALPLAPIFMALALRGVAGTTRLRTFLWASAAGMIVMLAIMMGVGRLVTRQNVGAWQRVNALSIFPWIGVASWSLRRALARSAPVRPQVEQSRSAGLGARS